MKILVTGGAGFIGSHLCERLLGDGHEVLCVDNFITGSRENVSHLEESFRLIEHDITLPFKEDFGDVDQIYHLASPASPVDYREIPLQTLWVNAAGTKNMLDLAAKNGVPLLYSSTSEVYGDPLEHPQKESYYGNVNPIGERSCYDEGKRFGESLSINYQKHFQFPLKIVRIFNTYGPRMRKHDGRVIPEFINNALNDEPLRVTGDGKQTRSFCFIDDMVDGLIAAMKEDESFVGPVNIGNPDEITIQDLAKNIVDLTESESIISFVERMEDDPMRRCPNIELAKNKFGFNPKVNLEEGLKKTILYFKS